MHCQICHQKMKSVRSLSKHIRDYHKELSIKEYYDKFLKDINEGKCVVCHQKDTQFINLGRGYRQTCSHVCGGILHRRNLVNNLEKNKSFIEKVSYNQEQIWKNRRELGTDREIRNLILRNQRIALDNLTEEERKELFHPAKNMSEEQRNGFFKKNAENGFLRWHKEASDEIKSLMQQKRLITKIQKGIINDISDMDDFKNYQQRVRHLTEKTYKEYKNDINPNGYIRARGKKYYHLDHKISIQFGFMNNIDPEIMASIYNLEIILGSDNCQKWTSCSISITKLLERYYG